MSLITVDAVSKAFWIPDVHRATLREHLLGMFEPRRFQRLQVLDGVSFDVRRGEALGIMGRNGSGKSTLLKIVCGVYPPDRGRVGTDAVITPMLELGAGWNLELDAVDNIYLIGSVMGLSLREIRHSVDEVLAFAEIERFAHLKLAHFSSGMASRLAYAVAFRAVREVLVLDEIFAVGDAGFRQRCEERYRQLHAGGHTMLLVSHDPRIISEFCTRALLLDHGRIVMDGPAADVAGRYLSTLTRAELDPPGRA
jgi:ABC-type polysaccharide/polyol phosphate transport system ATPase subunit